jgi:hypothetical protein
MESLRIEIINPKAKKLLEDLAALELIRITEDDSKEAFFALVSNLRSKNADLTLDDITSEVEAVRRKNFKKGGQ